MDTYQETNTSNCIATKWLDDQLGLVATNPVAKGQAIIVEKPLLYRLVADCRDRSCQWEMVSDLLRHQPLRKLMHSWDLFQNQAIAMDDDDMKIAKSLSRANNISIHIVIGLYKIICTNNIGFSDTQGNPYGYGMFELLSRANHACDPSCKLMGNSGSANPVVAAIALRDLEAGDPITWSYMDFHDSPSNAELPDFHTRNWLLANHHYFACKCSLCLMQMPEQLKGKDVYLVYQQLIRDETYRFLQQLLRKHPMGDLVTIPSSISPTPSPW